MLSILFKTGLGDDTPTSLSGLLIREHNIRAFNLLYASGGSDKSLINNIDGEDECDVLDKGYMRLKRMLRSIR